jgi:serine/threonine protein kinase HipA of HipAB toxin-antitoxin module
MPTSKPEAIATQKTEQPKAVFQPSTHRNGMIRLDFNGVSDTLSQTCAYFLLQIFRNMKTSYSSFSQVPLAA